MLRACVVLLLTHFFSGRAKRVAKRAIDPPLSRERSGQPHLPCPVVALRRKAREPSEGGVEGTRGEPGGGDKTGQEKGTKARQRRRAANGPL